VQPGAGDAPQVRIQRRVDRIERAAVALGRAAQQQRDRRQFGRGLKRHLEAIGFASSVATDRSVWQPLFARCGHQVYAGFKLGIPSHHASA